MTTTSPLTDICIATAAPSAVCTILVAIGLDPTALVPGLIGSICYQTLMPAKTGHGVAGALTMGSMLLASVVSPVASPWIIAHAGQLFEADNPATARVLISAGIGAFAQRLLMKFVRWANKATPGGKEERQQ